MGTVVKHNHDVFHRFSFWLHMLAMFACVPFEFLRLSPLNFVVDPCQSPVIIPWALEGAFLMSLIGAHVNASVLHGNLCRKWRLEVAFTGSWAECHLIMFSKHLQQPPKYPSAFTLPSHRLSICFHEISMLIHNQQELWPSQDIACCSLEK